MPNLVPSEFTKLISYFVEQEKKIGEGVHNKVQRPWMDLQELIGEVSNFNRAKLLTAFDRKTADGTYTQAWQKEDAKDIEFIVPKLAADFLAACERDFVEMRKRSRVRMMTHLGVRARLNGNETKGTLGRSTTSFLASIEGTKEVGDANSIGKS